VIVVFSVACPSQSLPCGIQLMFDVNGLGNHRMQTAGTDEPVKTGDDMDEENQDRACLHRNKTARRPFSLNLRIRHAQPSQQSTNLPGWTIRSKEQNVH
jgi:hypothetical protein